MARAGSLGQSPNLASKPRHYSTMEVSLLGAIKESPASSPVRTSTTTTTTKKRGTAKVRRLQLEGGGAETAAFRQPSAIAEVQPRRKKASRAQKQAVADLDSFDPSASSKAAGGKRSVTLPSLVPPGRSRSVLDDAATKARFAGEETAYLPDRFRSQSVEPDAHVGWGETTMVWADPQHGPEPRTDRRTMFANETRKFDHHKRRSTTNVKRIALDAETNSLYDPEAPSRLNGAGLAPDWNHNTGYGSIGDLDDETSRAPIPNELQDVIAKWSAMYRTAKGLTGKAGKGGKKGMLAALSDLELFERKVSGIRMDTTSNLAGRSGLKDGGVGDLPMMDGDNSKAWPSKSVSMHEALARKGHGTVPTPVIKLGRGNGHGSKRQRNFGAKKVMRPIAQEERLFAYARAAWGKHHHYLLHDRAIAHMREQSSPRSAAIQTALQMQ